MRPPWQPVSQDQAELEALQTDVMRFVAILGLCLAAIFSLVHSAALEQSATQAQVQAQVQVQKSTTSEPARDVVPKAPAPQLPVAVPVPSLPEPEPEKPPAGESIGFSLEFASATVLQQLLVGEVVQLYASHQDQFLRLQAGGGFTPAAAPASFYQMEADTVPGSLRRALALPGRDLAYTWGVTLPQAIVQQIDQLTATREGGALVIGAGGSVTLEVGARP